MTVEDRKYYKTNVKYALKKRQPFRAAFKERNIMRNYILAILAKIVLNVELGRIALLVNSGLGW
jgi:hypothetical protein